METLRVPRDLDIGDVADLLSARPKRERVVVICGSGIEEHLRKVSRHVLFFNSSNRVAVDDLEARVPRGTDRLIVINGF